MAAVATWWNIVDATTGEVIGQVIALDAAQAMRFAMVASWAVELMEAELA